MQPLDKGGQFCSQLQRVQKALGRGKGIHHRLARSHPWALPTSQALWHGCSKEGAEEPGGRVPLEQLQNSPAFPILHPQKPRKRTAKTKARKDPIVNSATGVGPSPTAKGQVRVFPAGGTPAGSLAQSQLHLDTGAREATSLSWGSEDNFSALCTEEVEEALLALNWGSWSIC